MILLCLRFTAMIMTTDATLMTVMAPTANSPPTTPSTIVEVYELEVYHNNKAYIMDASTMCIIMITQN